MGAGAGTHRPTTASTRRLRTGSGTSVFLLLMMCVQLINHVEGSSLCDRCETDEVRALRLYYVSLNLSSVYHI